MSPARRQIEQRAAKRGIGAIDMRCQDALRFDQERALVLVLFQSVAAGTIEPFEIGKLRQKRRPQPAERRQVDRAGIGRIAIQFRVQHGAIRHLDPCHRARVRRPVLQSSGQVRVARSIGKIDLAFDFGIRKTCTIPLDPQRGAGHFD